MKECCPPDANKKKNPCSPQKPSAGCPPHEVSCCLPVDSDSSDCCPTHENCDRPGYRLESFVWGWLRTSRGEIPQVARKLSFADRRGRWAMRWGLGRGRYQVAPGLYAVGTPDETSEILVSANYKLSFDILRSSLGQLSAWILVLDTKGINVWCAAGKGTFGTDEVIRMVKQTMADKRVSHRRLILPQLGAPGVAAHLVTKGCGFKVFYGPVLARDLPSYLTAGCTTTERMRQVRFGLLDRLILTPVEITTLRKQILFTALALLIVGGIGPQIFSFSAAFSRGGTAVLTALTGLLAGSLVTPILLPWLPGRAFALKGVWPGLALAILFGGNLLNETGYLIQMALLLQVTAISSYTAMNFTGSSTYTSPSGVEKEMRLAIPAQLGATALALALWLWSAF